MMKRFLIFAFVLALMLSPVCTAYSYNADYMSVEKWEDNDDVISGSIDKNGSFGRLIGSYSYYVDDADNCVYYYFSVAEDNISTSSDVSLEFRIVNENEEYVFGVDENGIMPESTKYSKLFSVHSKFSTYEDKGDYFVAVDINNGCKENYVSVYFHSRGRYVIDDLVDVPVIVPVTTAKNRTTTRNAISSKTTKQTTTISYVHVYEEVTDPEDTTQKNTKSKQKSTSRSSSNKRVYSTIPTSYDDYEGGSPTSSMDASEIDSNVDETTAFDYRSVIVAVAIAAAGVGIILFGLLYKRKNKGITTDNPDDFNF